MEESGDKAPELPVETENVRKNSNSISDIKLIPSADANVEGTTRKTSIVISKTIGDLHYETKNESSIKRVDSDSKFGVMETISLDLSTQDAVSSDSATEICENPLMLNRPVSFDSSNMLDNQGSEPQSPCQTTADSDGNSLSKYFSLPVDKEPVDSEGIQFFDALAESNQNIQSFELSENGQKSLPKVEDNQKSNENLNEDISANFDPTSSTIKENKEPNQPSLLKFFAEDKSGTDRDGKEFFDKIAAVNSAEDSNVLELNQPIIEESSFTSQFLISPMLNGEIEEAWLPSERVHQILVSVITSGSSFVPDKNFLTFPEIIIEDEMDDPVKSLLVEYNSPQAQQRKVLTANDVTEDENGLQKLIEAECYHAAVNLTKKLIRSNYQPPLDEKRPTTHTPLLLRLWYTRLAILVKLKKFSLAEVESAAFGDFERPDLYYEYYPDIYKGRKGTMVPFSFRLLLAELPQYQGNHQIALENMYHILNVIQKIIRNVENDCAEDGSMLELSESRKNASLEIWRKREQRVLYSILNCVLTQKDYILAVSIVNILLEKSKENSPQLFSALGRIYLQLGDVKYAQDCFGKAAAITCEKSQQYLVEENINKALLAIAHNNCEEAYKHFQQAYTLNPNNAMLASNMAVCLLYMGRLKESLSLLEKTIQKNPPACLHSGILFNICTLYELESSRCSQKKLAMLELVSKYAGDSFDISCLKIQPVK